MNKNIIIFDFDSTLVDSLGFWRKTIEHLSYEYYNLKPNKNLRGLIHGGNNIEKAKKVLNILNVKDNHENLLNFWKNKMSYFYTNKIKIIKEAKEFLINLKKQGKKLVIASATDEDLLKTALKHFDIDIFDVIFTERGLNISKKNPLFYQTCLTQLNTSKDSVIFFEDSFSAIKTAVNFGIESIGIINKFNRTHKQEMNELCKFTIKNFSDKKLNYLKV